MWMRHATIVSLALASMAAAAPATSAQPGATEKDSRGAFLFFVVVTSVGGPTMEQLDKDAADSGLTPGESPTGLSTDRYWSLTADDGLVELLVFSGEARTFYSASFSAPLPYQRLPDPILSWLLERSREVTLETFPIRDHFKVSLPETVLDGTGAFAGIQGRQIQTVRVSMAGEYLGRSIQNVWPHSPQ